MDGIKINVTGNIARVTEKPKYITSGTVGLPVDFTFDDQWDGLEKTAVFRAGDVFKIVSGLRESTTLPWEVLQNAHEWLSIGVYGTNGDGSVAIPTIWANVKVIDVGTSPNGDSCKAPVKAEWTRMLIGQSAYELAVALGFSGSEEAWIESLRGEKGDIGDITPELEALQTNVAQLAEKTQSAAEQANEDADRVEEAVSELEGGLVLKKGEGIGSVMQTVIPGQGEANTVKANQAFAANTGNTIKEGAIHGFASGVTNTINSACAFVAGHSNKVFGLASFACGQANHIIPETDVDKVDYSFAAGRMNKILGGESPTVLGYKNQVKGNCVFAVGEGNIVTGQHSAVFGKMNEVTAGSAFAAGYTNKVQSAYAFVTGKDNKVTGPAGVFMHGDGLKAVRAWQAIFGRYNSTDAKALLIVGNGTADDARSNAFVLRDDGSIYIFGSKTDYIVEQGEKGNWTYRKWYSGIAECWTNRKFSAARDTTYADASAYSTAIAVDLPFPMRNCVFSGTATDVTWIVNAHLNGTEGLIPGMYFRLCRGEKAAEDFNTDVQLSVKGYWK